MPGERRGGRLRGVPNKKTAERLALAERAAAEGKTPLDVMLANMRHFDRLAETAEDALSKLTAEAIADMSPDEQFKHLLAEVKKTVGFRELAQTCARDSAPFVHPKLAAIQHSGANNGPIRFVVENGP